MISSDCDSGTSLIPAVAPNIIGVYYLIFLGTFDDAKSISGYKYFST